jgi:hypothetical protein
VAYVIEPFVFAPNWASPVDEQLDWSTEIATAFDETEQRMSLRENPRRSFDYRLWVRRDKAALFENKLFAGMDKQWAMPIWTEPCKLTATSSSGSVTLNVSTTAKSFSVGGYAVLYSSSDKYELVQIDAMDSGTLTAHVALASTWPVGSHIYPVMVSQLVSQVGLAYRTSNLFEASVRFTGMPDVTNTRTDLVAAPASFGDFELYTKGTNWVSGLQRDMQTFGTDEDVVSGLFRRRPRSGIAGIVRSHQWLNKDLATSNTLREFFARRRGALTPTWLSSGTDDFQLMAAASSGDAGIQVIDTQYARLVDEHPARKYLLIELRSGVNLVREIIAYTPSSGSAVITLGTTLGTSISPATVKRISFLGLYRMAGDSVTFSWASNQVSTVQSTFKLLKPV